MIRRYSISGTGTAVGVPVPSGHGLVAWTFDPAMVDSHQTVDGGTVYLMKIYITSTVSVSKIYWAVGSAGVSPTAGQNEFGIYAVSGTRLVSVNVDAAVTSTGVIATTITPQTLQASASYWIGFVLNAATLPSLARAGPNSSGVLNANLSASGYRFAANAGGQAALAPSITPSANSQGVGWWAAVS